MAVIKVNQFGGEMPSASSRSIPAGAARKAYNLLARVNEFRPLAGDTVVAQANSGLINAQSLYRRSTSGDGVYLTNRALGWITTARPACYVKGQIDDDLTERTYASSLDGLIRPFVFDSLGVAKPLGVPSPTQIVATHNVVNEYSVAEDTAARAAIPLQISAAVAAARTVTLMGNAPNSPPVAGYFGWLSHASATAAGLLVTTKPGDWVFLSPMVASDAFLAGETSDPAYTMKYPKQSAFFLLPEFRSVQVDYGGGHFLATTVTMQGVGYTVNTTSLSTGLQAIKSPDDGVTQLIPTANCDTAAAAVAADYGQGVAPQSTSIAALNSAQAALQVAVNAAASQEVLVSSFKSFFAQSAISAEIANAVFNFAVAAADAEASLINPPTSTVDTGGN